jgi:hypothetical protein
MLYEESPSAHKGAVSRFVAWTLEPEMVADILNVDTSKYGVWTPRKGAAPAGGWVGAPGGITYFKEDTQNTLGWGVFDSHIVRSTGGGTWLVRASNVSCRSDVLHQFAEGIYANAAYATNQYRAIYGAQCVESSGTTESTRLFAFRADNVASELQSTQHASYAPQVIMYFQNRLWKANDKVAGDGNDLAWSELDDGLTYSPANEISVEPGVGGKIRALIPGRGSNPEMYVFKEDAIARFQPRWGASSALIPTLGDELDVLASKVELIANGVGCIATKSCIWVPGPKGDDVLYLARDGVRTLSRTSDDDVTGAGLPLSFSIPNWIDRINFDSAHKAAAAYFDNAYHLAVPMDGAVENSHVLRFDPINNAWNLFDWDARDISNIPFANSARLYFQCNAPHLDCSYTAAAESGTYQVYRAYNGDADPGGGPVDYMLETRALVFNNKRIEKQWDRLLFLGTVGVNETHTMRTVYRVDYQEWTTMATMTTFGVPGTAIVMGASPLPWVQPDQKLIQRRIGLQDVPPGTMIQFRFYRKDTTDFAKPEFFHLDASASPMQEIFDNSR